MSVRFDICIRISEKINLKKKSQGFEKYATLEMSLVRKNNNFKIRRFTFLKNVFSTIERCTANEDILCTEISIDRAKQRVPRAFILSYHSPSNVLRVSNYLLRTTLKKGASSNV